MATAVATYKRATLYINRDKQGWSETYDFIPTTSDAVVTGLGKAIAAWRQWTLPADCTIAYGRLAYITPPPIQRGSIPIVTSPMAGLSGTLTTAVATSVNDPEVGLLVRFQAESLKWAMRIIRGIPDDMIVNKALVPSFAAPMIMGTPPSTSAPVAQPGTWINAMQSFLNLVFNVTVLPSKLGSVVIGGVTQPGYTLYSWTDLIYREVRKKNVGSPFGRTRGRVLVR